MLFLFRVAQAILGLEEPLAPKGARWGFCQVVAFSHNFLPFTLFYFLFFFFQGTKRSNRHDWSTRQSWKESKSFVSFCSIYSSKYVYYDFYDRLFLGYHGTVQKAVFSTVLWLESTWTRGQHETLVLSNELMKVELPSWKLWKADFSSVSLWSEWIDPFVALTKV